MSELKNTAKGKNKKLFILNGLRWIAALVFIMFITYICFSVYRYWGGGHICCYAADFDEEGNAHGGGCEPCKD